MQILVLTVPRVFVTFPGRRVLDPVSKPIQVTIDFDDIFRLDCPGTFGLCQHYH